MHILAVTVTRLMRMVAAIERQPTGSMQPATGDVTLMPWFDEASPDIVDNEIKHHCARAARVLLHLIARRRAVLNPSLVCA